ncbi:hypothetical protein HW115_11640 [Verrucomicrobiaceae bacterium N1E253]|uniref:Lipoprotein n=1 Tax=Oceaniferula marina TaxID=2748318 RepID=A0A851GM93_9BACT|nr:hypothetical protein [Oceaniferula marina]NWK56265.1 hypothetical protein [Oceaniferula marina]
MNTIFHRHTLILALACPLMFNLQACKSKTSTPPPPTPKKESSVPDLQAKAEEVINNDPRVEIMKVVDGELHIRNVYSGRSVNLPFQSIIDGHYEVVREDEEMAKRYLANQKKKQNWLESTPGRGRCPDWIPSYKDMSIMPTKLHRPLQDGSIWGQISANHKDTEDSIRDFYIESFKQSGLQLTRQHSVNGKLSMIFENSVDPEDTEEETRRVNLSLSKTMDKTDIYIQYQYGFEAVPDTKKPKQKETGEKETGEKETGEKEAGEKKQGNDQTEPTPHG